MDLKLPELLLAMLLLHPRTSASCVMQLGNVLQALALLLQHA